MTKKTILITMLIFALGMSTVYAVAVSPYGQLFGFNLVKININQQEAQLRAIDVNGQIYVPIQLYVQEMNQGSYTYDLNSFTVNITRGVGSGTPTGSTSNDDNYNPYDPYGYYTGGNTGSTPTPYQPPVPYDPYQSDSGSGYQSYQSPYYDPRFDYEVLYDIVPYRASSERYHIGFIREDLESLEVFMEEIENMHDELDAVFASTIDRYNKDMTLAEAEKRFDIRMNTYEILEDRLDDLLDEVEDLESGRDPYETQLDDAIDKLDDAIKEQKNALKYLSRYVDNKRSSYRDRFDNYQEDTLTHLNAAIDALDEAVDGIEDALSKFER